MEILELSYVARRENCAASTNEEENQSDSCAPPCSEPRSLATEVENDVAPDPRWAQDETASSHSSHGGGDATPDSESHAVTPVNHEPSQTDAALAVIEAANGIPRLPGDSVVAKTTGKQFSMARVDQLVNMYKVGLDYQLLDYQWPLRGCLRTTQGNS